jgi:hypothetical protein
MDDVRRADFGERQKLMRIFALKGRAERAERLPVIPGISRLDDVGLWDFGMSGGQGLIEHPLCNFTPERIDKPALQRAGAATQRVGRCWIQVIR